MKRTWQREPRAGSKLFLDTLGTNTLAILFYYLAGYSRHLSFPTVQSKRAAAATRNGKMNALQA